MKMIVGSTWKAKMTAYCAPSGPNTFIIASPQTPALPSGPNTNAAPMPAKPSIFVM